MRPETRPSPVRFDSDYSNPVEGHAHVTGAWVRAPLAKESMDTLNDGDQVRFRRGERGHWHYGTVHGQPNKDGSVNVITDRMTRSLLPERLEVKRTNQRGRPEWHALETTSAPRS